MPVESSVKMEHDQQIGMQVCSSHTAPLPASAAAAWMQQAPEYQQQQQQQLQQLDHQQLQQQQAMAAAAVAAQMQGYHETQRADAATAAIQHAGQQPGADMHPGAAATAASADGMAHMMAAGVQQQHPASVGGLPGTLLMDHR